MTDYNEWFAKLSQEQEREASEDLKAAKVVAQAEGRELLDIEKVERLWPEHPDAQYQAYGYKTSREARIREWERLYYILLPKLRTTEEFVAEMKRAQARGSMD
jgi:hypothetical protein